MRRDSTLCDPMSCTGHDSFGSYKGIQKKEQIFFSMAKEQIMSFMLVKLN